MENLITQSAQTSVLQDIPRELLNEKDSSFRPPTVPIKQTRDEIFNFIKNPMNMPLYIKDLKSVTEENEKIWHWAFEFDDEIQEMKSEIIFHKKNEAIIWRLSNADGEDTTGGFALREDPAGRGTLVSFKLGPRERNPNKIVGVFSQLALGGNAKSDSFTGLRRLKAYLETGEVPTTKGQPNGEDQDLH